MQPAEPLVLRQELNGATVPDKEMEDSLGTRPHRLEALETMVLFGAHDTEHGFDAPAQSCPHPDHQTGSHMKYQT